MRFEAPNNFLRLSRHRLAFREFPLLAVLVAEVAYFSLVSNGFFSAVNLGSIGRDATIIGIMAIGLTYVVITSGIDLSCASILALSASVMAIQMQKGTDLSSALILGLAFAALLGSINAALVVGLAVPPIVATLATLSLFRVQAIKTVTLISPLPAGLAIFAKGWVASSILITALVVSHVVLHRTTFGRHVFAVGGSPSAAKLAGLPVGRIIVGTYIVSGICAGVAGIIASATMNSVQGNMLTGYELDTIAAVVIGGTAIAGGRGSVAGSVIGSAIMASLRNGLVVSGRDVYWYQAIIGLAILLVGFLNHLGNRDARCSA